MWFTSRPSTLDKNTAKRTLDPKVHDQMLHGDAVTPQGALQSDAATSGGKSRQQVAQELRNQPTNEREQMKMLYTN